MTRTIVYMVPVAFKRWVEQAAAGMKLMRSNRYNPGDIQVARELKEDGRFKGDGVLRYDRERTYQFFGLVDDPEWIGVREHHEEATVE